MFTNMVYGLLVIENGILRLFLPPCNFIILGAGLYIQKQTKTQDYQIWKMKTLFICFFLTFVFNYLYAFRVKTTKEENFICLYE